MSASRNPEDADDEWLWDGNGRDDDDPLFEEETADADEIATEDSWQFARRLEQIQACQANDQTCYLVWYGSKAAPSEAEIIYPIDSQSHVINLLSSWKASQLEEMEIITEWPTVNVHRVGLFLENPPSVVQHFCHSHRAMMVESLYDIFAAVKQYPDLGYQILPIAQCMLARHEKQPWLLQKVHALVIDLLQQGGDHAQIAEEFLNRGTTGYRAQYHAAFSLQDIQEASATGICRTNARFFQQNTGIPVGDVKDLEGLQVAIEKEQAEMHEQLYKNYIGSLRFTTSEATVNNVLIPLTQHRLFPVQEAARKKLAELGYRCDYSSQSLPWKRSTSESVS